MTVAWLVLAAYAGASLATTWLLTRVFAGAKAHDPDIRILAERPRVTPGAGDCWTALDDIQIARVLKR